MAASGGRRRASDRASKGRRAGGTAALEERLHALYMGETVIPLPMLRASSAAALALQPYPEGGEEASWLQVLTDVALESYSGAPGSRPDRAHAVPPAALEQVRARVWLRVSHAFSQVKSSPGLLNLLRILAYHKRMAQEEVMSPDALRVVQGQIHDLSDTLKTILCL